AWSRAGFGADRAEAVAIQRHRPQPPVECDPETWRAQPLRRGEDCRGEGVVVSGEMLHWIEIWSGARDLNPGLHGPEPRSCRVLWYPRGSLAWSSGSAQASARRIG